MIIESIKAYINRYQLLVSSQPIVVGVSGGADSVALLDALLRIGYVCIVAHCNFHLRGDESDRDQEFVRALASKLKVPFVKVDFETEVYAAEKHISIEMAARDLRYSWFEQLRLDFGAQAIAVAHHRDDSVETLLLNLIRGTGIRGMTGIRPKNGYVVRPLLLLSRVDVLQYLEERRLDYVTDSTNLSDTYTRNFIRLKVLPLLTEINPSVKNSIVRTAEHLSDVELVFLEVIAQAQKVVWEGDRLSVKRLLTFPAPKTILYELLRPYGFTRLLTDAIYLSLDKSSGKSFFSTEYRLVKDRDYLLLQLNKKVEVAVYTIDAIATKECEIDYPITLSFCKEEKTSSFVPIKDKHIAYFDYNKLIFPLTLRNWKAGDWFVPFGMKGRKKLSDYFTDHKFSLVDKENCWLLCSGNDILWIIGERTDNRYRVDNLTKNVCTIKFFDKKN